MRRRALISNVPHHPNDPGQRAVLRLQLRGRTVETQKKEKRLLKTPILLQPAPLRKDVVKYRMIPTALGGFKILTVFALVRGFDLTNYFRHFSTIQAPALTAISHLPLICRTFIVHFNSVRGRGVRLVQHGRDNDVEAGHVLEKIGVAGDTSPKN